MKRRRQERRAAHWAELKRRERDGRSPPTSPEDTPEPEDSSKCDEPLTREEGEEAPSSSAVRGTDAPDESDPLAMRTQDAPLSAAGAASLSGGASPRGSSGSGVAQPPSVLSKKRKRQVSIQW